MALTREQLNNELNAIKQNQQNQNQQTSNNIKAKELQLQQSQLNLKTQQQNFNHKLQLGGFILAAILVLALVFYLISKTIRGGVKKHTSFER